MSLLKTYTETERELLYKHGLCSGNVSQLSDAFVIGVRCNEALTEINRLQSEECKQLQQDKAELREALKALVKVEHERGGTLGVSGSFNYPVPEGVFIKAKKLLEKHKCD